MKKIIDITQLVTQVNTVLKEGATGLADAERQLGYGKDSIRQRLKRNGYIYNKQLNEVVLQDNTNTTQSKERVINNKDTYNPVSSSSIEPKEQEIFTKEEILFLKELYTKHKLATQLTTQGVTQENEELITRSIRIDKTTINSFAQYCKDKNIKQSTALKIALKNFMQN